MFFLLSKLLAFLITPIIWIIGLLLYSLLAKNEKRKKRMLSIALILLLFFSNTLLFEEAMRLWEKPTTTMEFNTTYDAGIVLGGIISFNQAEDRLQFNRRNDRLMQAVLLYKKGTIRKIFFTGGSGSVEHPDIKEGPLVKKFLLETGIPETDILIESESNNTHENAVFSKPLLEKNFTSGKFLLITSAFHMRRSIGCFEKSGIAVTPYPTDFYAGRRTFSFGRLVIPNAETLFNWDSLIHEMFGYLVYKISGYA
ncbi:MAG: YdcF family protein [Bacteroidetes bacterium]|nr:YdcF family protein [Bacteroidota bacterium]